jgi:DUF971 family protein
LTAVSGAWPTEIRLSQDKRLLTVSYEDGTSVSLDAELLRVFSPSAEVQGHSAAERKTVGAGRAISPNCRKKACRAIVPARNRAVQALVSTEDRLSSALCRSSMLDCCFSALAAFSFITRV